MRDMISKSRRNPALDQEEREREAMLERQVINYESFNESRGGTLERNTIKLSHNDIYIQQ